MVGARVAEVMGTDLNSIFDICSGIALIWDTDIGSEFAAGVAMGLEFSPSMEGMQIGAVNRGTSLPVWEHSSQHLLVVSIRVSEHQGRRKKKKVKTNPPKATPQSFVALKHLV